MFPFRCTVIKMSFRKHHCSGDWKYCRRPNSETFLQERKICFINAVCLGWSEVAEWAISFPIRKNQRSPDRCVFIQSGFMWNDFWWPLSSCPIQAEMLLHQRALDHYLSPPHPPGRGSSATHHRVPDWISHTCRLCTLLVHTVTWRSRIKFPVHTILHKLPNTSTSYKIYLEESPGGSLYTLQGGTMNESSAPGRSTETTGWWYVWDCRPLKCWSGCVCDCSVLSPRCARVPNSICGPNYIKGTLLLSGNPLSSSDFRKSMRWPGCGRADLNMNRLV